MPHPTAAPAPTSGAASPDEPSPALRLVQDSQLVPSGTAAPLALTEWLPTPSALPAPLVRRPGPGRPVRDSPVLADLRARFPEVAADTTARQLYRSLAEAMRAAFLCRWRHELGAGPGEELVVVGPTGMAASSVLVRTGQVEQLLVALAVSTAERRTVLGRTQMAELHAAGFVGAAAVRAGREARAARRRSPTVCLERYQAVLEAVAAPRSRAGIPRLLAKHAGDPSLGALVEDAWTVMAAASTFEGWLRLTAALAATGVLAG